MSGASSPCVQICVIDPVSRLCEGCLRTLQEIADWSRLSEAERLAIMTELPLRKIAPNEPSQAAG
ncbi:DUF1289 domain-containing protein [Bosea sp. 2RAB26]|uniref:DUF1289 domain-containing protein n=1 Tax=Bosea sp. 2RAB26 TaxID=3237476 RepID=UPI003F8F9E78